MRKTMVLSAAVALGVLGCGDEGGNSPTGPNKQVHPVYGTWEQRIDTTHPKGKRDYDWAVEWLGRWTPDTMILNIDSTYDGVDGKLDPHSRFSFDRDSIYFWNTLAGYDTTTMAYRLVGERMDTLEIGPDSITAYSWYVRVRPGI